MAGSNFNGSIKLYFDNLINLSRVSNLPKNRFQLSSGLNLETLNTILVEPTVFEQRLKLSRGSNSLNAVSEILKLPQWILKEANHRHYRHDLHIFS